MRLSNWPLCCRLSPCMIIPLGDDNSDRRRVPFVTYLLIAANLVVFFVLQGFGNDYVFTYAFSTVPEEILTGQDLVTEGRVYSDPITGNRYAVPGRRQAV